VGVRSIVSKGKTLVVLPAKSQESNLSGFLAMVRELQDEVDVRDTKDSEVYLENFGERTYDNIILLAPKTKSFASADLSPKGLKSFMAKGGNILFSGGTGSTWLSSEVMHHAKEGDLGASEGHPGGGVGGVFHTQTHARTHARTYKHTNVYTYTHVPPFLDVFFILCRFCRIGAVGSDPAHGPSRRGVLHGQGGKCIGPCEPQCDHRTRHQRHQGCVRDARLGHVDPSAPNQGIIPQRP